MRGLQAALVEPQRRLPGKKDITNQPARREPFTRNKSSNRLLKPTNPRGDFQLKLDEPHSKTPLFAPISTARSRGVVAGRAKSGLHPAGKM